MSSGSEKENTAVPASSANRKRKIASALTSSDESGSEDTEYVPVGKMFRPEGKI